MSRTLSRVHKIVENTSFIAQIRLASTWMCASTLDVVSECPYIIQRCALLCHCPETYFHLAGPSCRDSPTPWQEGWRELEQLYSEGAVRAIGVSNFSQGLLRELLLMATVVPAAVQNWMDPFHQDKAVRALCAEHGESSRSRNFNIPHSVRALETDPILG